MSAPTDPIAAQAGRVANQTAVLEWLDALSTGHCDQGTFLERVDELLQRSEDAAWEVLSLLDQYYRRGKIKTNEFQALKSHLQRSALGAGDDVGAGSQSPARKEDLRPPSTTVPVAKEPAAAAADAHAAPLQAPRPERERMPAAGDVLRGRYRIIGVLGQGGMGTVFEAVDLDRIDLPQAGQKLAVKVLHSAVTQRPQLLAELRSEFQHLQSLSHPNIVRVHEFDRDGDTAFFTMELLRGASLGRLLAKREGGILDRPHALSIVRDVGAALAHAHSRGVVHGDINPQNIFVTRDSGLRVLDFGASHKLKRGPWIAEFETRRPRAVATPGYASCQVLEGEVAEVRDDVFGFACVIYLLLAGRHPFEGRTALEARDLRLKPRRPAGLTGRQWNVVQEALWFERERRPADIRDWLARLRLDAPAIPLPPLSAWVPSSAASAKWIIAASCIFAVAILVLAGLWLKRNDDGHRESTAVLSTEAAPPADTAGQVAAVTEGASAVPTFAEAPSRAPAAVAPAAAPASLPAPAVRAGKVPIASPVAPPTAPAPASAPLPAPTLVPVPAPAPVPASAPAVSAAAAVKAPPPAPRPATHARVELAAAVVVVPRGDAVALVPVRRKGSLRGAASFKWWTESGTAKAGADFAPIAVRLETIADRKKEIDDVVENEDENENDEEYDDAEPGSVDEYMLRLVEWDWDYFY